MSEIPTRGTRPRRVFRPVMADAARDLFSEPGPRWFAIEADRPFLEDLARGVLSLCGEDPETLSSALVLVPTRRAARLLDLAFRDASSRSALFLPRIQALGELDAGEPPFEPGDLALDMPAAVAPLRRRLALAALAMAHEPDADAPRTVTAALGLGDALGALLESLHIEERLDPEAIDALVTGDLARHWARLASTLSLASRRWPEWLAENGLLDPAERRVALLRALGKKWRSAPPDHVVIAAGSTGTTPATADLIGVIANLPLGAVVLPGLDRSLAHPGWSHLDEQHPQSSMARLLARHRIERADVRGWPASFVPPPGEGDTPQRSFNPRLELLQLALWPADLTGDWLERINSFVTDAGVDGVDRALAGLSLIEAAQEDEASLVAALLMRESLEENKSCILVTPDADLARRTAARLSRWGLEIEPSNGAPLINAPIATLLARLVEAAHAFSPVALLAVLKSPLARFGLTPARLAASAAILERRALRGPRPDGPEGMLRRLDAALDRLETEAPDPDEASRRRLEEAVDLARRALSALAPLRALFETGQVDVSEAARALAAAVERACEPAEGMASDPWSGPDGDAAARLLDELAEAGASLGVVTGAAFGELLQSLLAGVSVRRGVEHPKLAILGAIEARMARAERMVLAGLEEGVWPPAAGVDPFLSRPMRKSLGLPSPERRIGLSAHDFAQAASAPEVVMIHTQKRDGKPTTRSRWLWRLETALTGVRRGESRLPGRPEVLAWARGLDRWDRPAPAKPPEPRPPLDVRPRRLSVTRIETWVRDPYSIYARSILNLRPLPRPDETLEARARGDAVHRALQRLCEEWPKTLPEDGRDRLFAMMLEAMEAFGLTGPRLAAATPGLALMATWLHDHEVRRRAQGPTILVETTGEMRLERPGGAFTLTAKADRIERLGANAHIIDFKTGLPPAKNMVARGFSPQLTLTGAIVQAGGFDGGPARPEELAYVQATGRGEGGKTTIIARGAEAVALCEKAHEGLVALVDRFDDPGTAYRSWTAPDRRRFQGDYDHLARVYEWMILGDEDEPEGEDP